MWDLFNFDYLSKNPQLIPLATGIYAFTGLMVSTILKAVFDWLINKNKIRADIIVKARLEWIKEVREISGDLISNCRMTIYYHNLFFPAKTPGEKDEILTKAIDNYMEMLKISNKLRLYLPRKKIGRYNKEIPNKKNRDLYIKVLAVNKLSKELVGKMRTGGYPDDNSRRTLVKKFNDATGDFAEEASLYLKSEWERAKKNK